MQNPPLQLGCLAATTRIGGPEPWQFKAADSQGNCEPPTSYPITRNIEIIDTVVASLWSRLPERKMKRQLCSYIFICIKHTHIYIYMYISWNVYYIIIYIYIIYVFRENANILVCLLDCHAFIHILTYFSAYLFTHWFIYSFLYHLLIYLSVYLLVYLSICLFVYMCMYAIWYKHATWYGG